MAKKKSNKKKHNIKKQNQSQNYSILQLKQMFPILFSFVIFFFYFSIPYNKWWFEERILRYYKEVPHQIEILDDIDKRLLERHGYNYYIPKAIKEQTPDSANILIPTSAYVKKNYSSNYFRWQSLTWSYYFIGDNNFIIYRPNIKQDLSNITHAIVCKNKNIQIVRINSENKLDTVLKVYNNDG